MWARAGLIIALLLIVAALAYPLQATRLRLQERFPIHPSAFTLNAFSWMDSGEIQYTDGRWIGYADDRVAIDWLNHNVFGTPVIAEASIGRYSCNGSRFSIATGLPSVMGWLNHERQQRQNPDLKRREDDLRTLYASTSIPEKAAILDRYAISYVIVGETERAYPIHDDSNRDCIPTDPSAGIAIFDHMIGTRLEVAFQHGTTTIYRVLPAASKQEV